MLSLLESTVYLLRYHQLANILEIIYPPVMFSAKLAILLQIQRIFTKHERNFNYWAVKMLIASNALTYFALFFAFVFACWPREKIWNPHTEGRCISTNASIIATSAINIVSDITILVLPLLSIARLNLPTRKKLGVGAVFATGALWVLILAYLSSLTNEPQCMYLEHNPSRIQY
jgi:hypothetical protein